MSRNVKGFAMNLLSDFRYAARSLRRRPGLTVSVVLTAALAIGACTALFDLANLISWMPIPGTDSSRLVRVYTKHHQPVIGLYGVSPAVDHARYEEHATSFEQVIGERWARLMLEPAGSSSGIGGTAVEVRPVSANFFQALGVNAEFGRVLEETDHLPAAAGAAVASERFFRTHFVGDTSLIGTTFLLNEQEVTLVGVANRAFETLVAGERSDLWIADAVASRFVPGWNDDPTYPSTDTLARLRPGVSIRQAQEELQILADELDRTHPLAEMEREIMVVPARLSHGIDQRNFQPVLKMLGVAVLLLLTLSCANIANLLLGRALERGQETALRQALGASFSRLLRLMMAESILLSLLAGVAGLGIAFMARRLFALWHLEDFAAMMRFDYRVLLLSLATCIGTALAFGTLPAVLAARTSFYGGLRQKGTSRGTLRAFSGLTALQLGLATVLVACSAAIAANLLALRAVDLGFDDTGLVRAPFVLGDHGYDGTEAQEVLLEIERRAQGYPGVESTARSIWIPPMFFEIRRSFRKPGEEQLRTSLMNQVGGSYFDTLGVPLLHGRTFAETDSEVEPLLIVNQEFARQTWPELDPAEVVGRTLFLPPRREVDPPPEHRIIGVVGTITLYDLRSGGEPILYLSLDQRPRTSASLIARVSGDPAGYIENIREIARAINPELAPVGANTSAQLRWNALVAHRLQAQMAMILAVIGLSLSLLGVFGVMQMMVTRRQREVGVRMAMGADRKRILAFVLWQTSRLAITGTVIGLIVSVSAANLLTRWVRDLESPSPWIFAITSALLVTAALAAAWLPARRAARIEPIDVLRSE